MRKLRIREHEEGNPNTKIDVLLKDFSRYLKNKDICVTDIDYSTKTIYVDTVEELKRSRRFLRTEFPELVQLGAHVQSAVGVPGSGLNKDYIMKNRAVSESLWDEDEDGSGRYEYVKSKEVIDSDGFQTEYTMYYDTLEDRYVFVFGDSDMYDPNYGYEEFDWECDTELEANEWFRDYTGYEDDLDESLKEPGDIEKLSLQDFYRWFDINYGGDLEDFRDYKVALTKAKVVRLKNNKYVFDTDEALKYDRNGQLK